MVTVYTTGVFDLLHSGHVDTLRRARAMGDKLVVGIQSDESVARQKGKRPVMSAAERMDLLGSLPFVDRCLSYDDIDQRPLLRSLQPGVMVQTEEWIQQTDRSKIIDFLKENNIRLVLLPINKTISSSEIKRRVLENETFARHDISLLRDSLAVLPLNSLLQYEKSDPSKVADLCARMTRSGTFFNPISVGVRGESRVVIDGANRFAALSSLGATRAFVHLIPYDDQASVNLKNNAHFLPVEPERFQELAAAAGLRLAPIGEAEALSQLAARKIPALCIMNQRCWTVAAPESEDHVGVLNRLVGSYIGQIKIYRLSEFSRDDSAQPVKIVFRSFTIDEVEALARRRQTLESGITWHSVLSSMIRFYMPLAVLTEAYTDKQAEEWLAAEMARKIEQNRIRFYPSNVYIFDEWE
ncbi:MAG: Glycerol-3-phosphate cytidylyltransferase [Candidatus Magasanikbacteria bacterium GW2011_GWA2_56_11]|uniref:Glycerol-3-phosphate cytidylyltransferase n=1 Tax=Candidatus Magasanikbacteria bacterium GW2011_GWA2_56_11 TaxID=1619044 RepID=A0A0G2AM31_9BACT|nr:MAG: Glycerol-3-phosphate cytidylyltransferase [Candidatus Magasanikbacteria bacterium GW2011_GWA2_56_11]